MLGVYPPFMAFFYIRINIGETTARAKWALAQTNESRVNVYIFQVHIVANLIQKSIKVQKQKESMKLIILY